MRERVWLSPPHMSGNEMKYINEAFDQNWIAPLGPNVNNFEKELGEYLNVKNVAVLTSGTAAIHLALILLNVKEDDEVLVSSFTFSATVNPIIYQKAKPVFIDSEKDTWNMNPVLLEETIEMGIQKGKKPKAIIIVHLYGMPANMEMIIKIAEKYDIPVIEDAAEALGSSFKNQKLGSFGDFSILSFNGNKIITSSGGGALISNSEENIQEARFLATQARDNAPHYQHSKIGYNYRMSNIVAGIGRGQLSVINERVKRRREINTLYKNNFENIEGVNFLNEPNSDYYSNYWLTTVIFDSKIFKNETREIIRFELEKHNIETRPLWKPMHIQPVFEKFEAYIDGTSEDLFNHGLCLPSGSSIDDDTIHEISRIIIDLIADLK